MLETEYCILARGIRGRVGNFTMHGNKKPMQPHHVSGPIALSSKNCKLSYESNPKAKAENFTKFDLKIISRWFALNHQGRRCLHVALVLLAATSI